MISRIKIKIHFAYALLKENYVYTYWTLTVYWRIRPRGGEGGVKLMDTVLFALTTAVTPATPGAKNMNNESLFKYKWTILRKFNTFSEEWIRKESAYSLQFILSLF